jgi:hypothetical protein
MRLARLGGILAIVASVGLFVRILVVDQLNASAVATLTLAGLAGLVAVLVPDRVGALMSATLILVVAMLPAVFGWVPLLYAPSLALFVSGALRVAKREGEAG